MHTAAQRAHKETSNPGKSLYVPWALAVAKPATYCLSLIGEFVMSQKALIMCGNDEFDIICSLEMANTHRDVPAG